MANERSAGAVIFRKQEGRVLYLLLHYEAGHWDFVKGHIGDGEQEKETVLRETEEETGIRGLEFIEGFRERTSYFYKREDKTIFKEVVFYLASTGTKNITLSHEHEDSEWLEYLDAEGRLTYSNSRKVLEKADKFLKAQSHV